jgi:hypothetical protein
MANKGECLSPFATLGSARGLGRSGRRAGLATHLDFFREFSDNPLMNLDKFVAVAPAPGGYAGCIPDRLVRS